MQRVSENLHPRTAPCRYGDPRSPLRRRESSGCVLDQSLFRAARVLEPQEFTSPFLRKVYEELLDRYRSGPAITPAAVAAGLSGSAASQLTVILGKPESVAGGERAMGDYIEKIRSRRLGGQEDLLLVAQRLREKKGYGG
jgi:hypothetical protein